MFVYHRAHVSLSSSLHLSRFSLGHYSIAVTPLASASRPSFSRGPQSYTCERVAPYSLATSDKDTTGRKLTAAIRARSASLRCFRPVGPSRTSRREFRPVDDASNWASILPPTAMIRNSIQNWTRFSHAQNGFARLGSALGLQWSASVDANVHLYYPHLPSCPQLEKQQSSY